MRAWSLIARGAKRSWGVQGIASRRVTVAVLASLAVVVTFVSVTTTAWASDVFVSMGSTSSWLGVAAVAIASYTSAMCAARWRTRAYRLLGLTAGALAVYFFAVLCSFGRATWPWEVLMIALWPSIPLTIAFWARSSFAAVASTVTRHAPSKSWAGKRARDLVGVWRPLSVRSIKILGVRFSKGELVIVWVPCIALSGLGLYPGLLYRIGPISDEAWRGRIVTPTAWFIFVLVWAGIVLIGSMLLLEASWATRARSMTPCARGRVRAARYAAWAAVGVAALVAANHMAGWWSEPMVDFALSLIVIAYAVRIIDHDLDSERLEAYRSVRGRALWSAGWIGFSVFVAAVTREGPILGAALAGSVAVILPLLGMARIATGPRSLRRLSAPDAQTEAVSEADAEDEPAVEPVSLDEVLCATVPPDPRAVDQDLAAKSLSCLDGVTVEMLTGLFAIVPVVSQKVKPGRRLPIEPETAAFLSDWPPLSVAGSAEEKAREFLRLTYRSIVRDGREAYDARKNAGGPSDAWITSRFLLMRVGVATDIAAAADERIERHRYRLWLRRAPQSKKGVVAPGPYYEFAAIMAMTEAELIEAIKGRSEYEGSKKKRQRSVNNEVADVLDHWRRQLAACVDASLITRR